MPVRKLPTTFTALAAAALLLAPKASAGAIAVTSCSLPDVQAAVDRAVDGDEVTIPAGNCTWSAPVVFADKNVYVRGAGIGQTVITSNQEFIFYVGISNPAKGSFRIGNMTLTGGVTTDVIKVTSAAIAAVPSGRWRIDHIHFNFRSSQRSGVHVSGVNYGLVDHNVFDWYQGIVIRHSFGLNSEDCSGLGSNYATYAGNFASSLPADFGTNNFVFVEDNTFTSYRNDGVPMDVYDSSAGGGRVVFRYNNVKNGRFYNHWTRGCEVAAQVMEVYNNSWTLGSTSNADPGQVARIEGGTGVFFNNYSTYNNGAPYIVLDDRRSGGFGGPVSNEAGAGTWGYCDGTHKWDGNAGDPSAPGWPCLGQIGRAPGVSLAALAAGTAEQASAPFYLWNNGTDPGCATGGGCTNSIGAYPAPASYIRNTPHPNGQVDYMDNNTPKPGYSPYAYPHPLVSGSGSGSGSSSSSAPAPPTNVRIVPGA